MIELATIKAIVKDTLKQCPQTRNSDSLLYLAVIQKVGLMNNPTFDITSLTVPYFLQNIDYLGLPHFETVRRTRQKVQAEHPELQGNARARRKRALLEKEYKKFAKRG